MLSANFQIVNHGYSFKVFSHLIRTTSLAMRVYLTKSKLCVGSTNTSSILEEIRVKSLLREKVLGALALLFFSWLHKQEVSITYLTKSFNNQNLITFGITCVNFIHIGLFQQAIGESGSVLAEWALDRDGRGKEASLKIAEMSGCPVEPYEDLLICVQNVDAETLTKAYQDYSVRFQKIYF